MQRKITPTTVPDIRRAVILAVVGEALLTLMDTLIKSLTPRYPTFEIAFLRYLSGSLCTLPLVAVMRPPWPDREATVANTVRALLVVVTATSFFYALGKLQLVDALAMSFLSPTFVAVFSVLLLGERIGSNIVIALACGFAGMLLIVAGEIGKGEYTQDTMLGIAACLISAIAYALALVLLRHRAQRDGVAVILLFQNAVPAAILVIPAALVWVTPSSRDAAVFALLGGLGVAGHFLMVRAFAQVEASRLAPIQYTTLAWGILFGYVAFGAVPGVATLCGAAMIVAATLLTRRPS